MRRGHRVAVAASVTLMVCWAMRSPAQDAPPPAADRPEPAVDAPPTPKPPVEATREETRAPSQPSAEEIMSAFERDRPVDSVAKPKQWRDAAGAPARRRKAKTMVLMREGEYVHNVAGRLQRSGSWWTLVFEADSAEAPKRPMRLLPNQQLERIVMETKASSEVPVFLISGEVTLYESYNYVLVRKALRRRTTNNLDK